MSITTLYWIIFITVYCGIISLQVLALEVYTMQQLKKLRPKNLRSIHHN